MSETTWRHAPGVSHVDSGDRVVAVDLSAPEPRPQVLEGVAAVVWRLLEEPCTEQQVVDGILAEYDDVDADQVRDDVRGFLAQLSGAGLAVSG